ncbi:MAG: hypothetical protein C4278_02020, partial [Patescibacteria group bacterium]
NLEEIGDDAYFGFHYFGYSRDSRVRDLGNLIRIGGYASFSNSQITSLKNLEEIGGYAHFDDSPVTDLGNLR